MLYVPKIDGYWKIVTDEEVKNFIVINFNEYFRSIRGGRSLRKVARLL